MKLIEAVHSVQSQPYIAFLLSKKAELAPIVNSILLNCSRSSYCVRAIDTALLDAHITALCLYGKGANLISLTAWFLASKFDYLIEEYVDIEVAIDNAPKVTDLYYRDYLYENKVTDELIRRYATHYTSGELCRDTKVVYETIILQIGVDANETVCKGFNEQADSRV